MNDTQAILAAQRQEYSRWEDMLAGITEETATVFHSSAGMSIKDVVAHLMAWQQVSTARLEAARLSREPVLPDWLAGGDPESEEHIEQFNARIQATYAPRPWAAVHQSWREGYLRLVALAEEMPVDELVTGDRYPWLNGHALVDVLAGSLEHHVEHAQALHAERINRTMNAETRALLDDIRSPDGQKQNAAYYRLIEVTDQPVDWAYVAWDELLAGLKHKDNHVRAISAQVLSNLAKSDPEQRMLTDFGALLAVTKDDRFVTARHCLQSLWKVGAAGTAQRAVYLDGLEARFHECASEKNCTLIRYDIIQSLRNVYDAVGGSSDVQAIKTRALALIETEPDPKYRKKYATVGKNA